MFEKTLPNYDFLFAKLKHIDWRIRFCAFLEGKECITQDEIASPHCCELGQWIDAEGLKKYPNLQEIRELEQLHSQLHDISQKLLLQNSQNSKVFLSYDYEKLQNISNQIITLLEDLEQKINQIKNE
jgi:hypothetical protein